MHDAMGDTISCVDFQITRYDLDLQLLDMVQVGVITTRTKYGKEISLVLKMKH